MLGCRAFKWRHKPIVDEYFLCIICPHPLHLASILLWDPSLSACGRSTFTLSKYSHILLLLVCNWNWNFREFYCINILLTDPGSASSSPSDPIDFSPATDCIVGTYSRFKNFKSRFLSNISFTFNLKRNYGIFKAKVKIFIWCKAKGVGGNALFHQT